MRRPLCANQAIAFLKRTNDPESPDAGILNEFLALKD